MKPTTLRMHPGARLGWSAARIRAHELSAPKRPQGFAKPVGDPRRTDPRWLDGETKQRLAFDIACQECGHSVCSCAKRGPCAPPAPPAPPPKAPDVPAVDAKAWIRVGVRVRHRYGREGEVIARSAVLDGMIDVTCRWDDGCVMGTSSDNLEPLEPADEREGWMPGTRLRGTSGDIAGLEGTVLRWERADCVVVRFDGDDCETWASPEPFERIDAVAALEGGAEP